MDTHPQGKDTEQTPAASASRIEAGQSRRALLRMGAGASPILLTLASGPAAAQACIVASVYMSADTFASRFQGQTLQCGAPLTPANRVSGRGTLPPAGDYAKLVSEVLGPVTSNPTAAAYSGATVYDIYDSLYDHPSDKGILQLLLTLQLAGNPGLPADYAKGVWQNYAGTNAFARYTATGISWYTIEVFAYLKRIVDPSTP
jgi:hypothetical protein